MPANKARSGKPRKNAPEGLSVSRITAAALRIADREGLEALSIRRIAKELRAGTMSLYRHASGKDQILDLLLDAAYGEIVVPAAVSRNWKEDLRDMARQTREVLKRHWWLAPLLTSRPTFGPNYLRWFEFLLAATAVAGDAVDMRTKVRIIGTLFAFVNGVVAYELGEEATNRRHNLTPERKRAMAAPVLGPLLACGRFPNLAEFVAQGSGEPSDEDFEFGMDCILDGLGSRISGTIAKPASPGRSGNASRAKSHDR